MHLMIDTRENSDEVFLEETSKNPKQIKVVVSSYFNAWKNLKKSSIVCYKTQDRTVINGQNLLPGHYTHQNVVTYFKIVFSVRL